MDRLASQHHLSHYNRLRYGLQGSPLRYHPLSTAFPAQFHLLQLRQQLAADLQTCWLVSRDSLPPSLSEELQAAIDEPLTPQSPSGRIKTSTTHPINISCLLPHESISLISSHAVLVPTSSPVLLEVPPALHVQSVAQPASDIEPPPSLTTPASPPVRSELTAALEAAIAAALPSAEEPAISLSLSVDIPLLSFSPRPFSLGNLYMSSCPGKKVRLDGPVKNGRSAVCRDLDMDLGRMKALGIGCIVCCLDDEELGLLGVPWSAYEQSAQGLGIDILRLPIPEGLPPVSTAYLDLHLGKLLQDYTLKGISVLVHCRGGVGRAGVIACCWLIKLGICGWPVQQETPSDFVEFVDAVISFVRRRRNYKVVETFEQVQFLVDYVEFLHNKPL